MCARMCVYHVEPEFTSGAILLVAFLSYHLRCHLSLNLEFNNLTRLQISQHQSSSPMLELQAPLSFYEVAGDEFSSLSSQQVLHFEGDLSPAHCVQFKWCSIVLRLSYLKLFTSLMQAFCAAVSSRSSVLVTVTKAALITVLIGGLVTVSEN